MSQNFYHKQNPVPVNRRDRVLVIDSPTQRSKGKINPDTKPEQQVTQSIKLFLIALVAMLGLLFLSIKAVEILWGRRDRAVMRSVPATKLSTAPAILSTGTVVHVPAIAIPNPETSIPAGPDKTARGEIDRIYRWGKVLEDAGELDGALARYQEALAIDPENVALLSQIGRLNIRLAKYREAVNALSLAYRNNPDQPDIMNDYGVAMTFNGQLAEAVELYDRMREKHPEYVPAFFNQGYALVQLRDYERARPLLELYIEQKEDDAMALGVLAILEIGEKNFDKALVLLDRAIAINPTWSTPYLDAATISALTRQPDRALNYLIQGLEQGTPAEVYQVYQSSPFAEIRLTEEGKNFEGKIAAKAREMMK